ncbi:uncharacterized protein LOC125652575 isoform X1 [Ostrea edulis]|uniref:uncharacterized protein LOC125652575 isoform X1 n=1 Tax=Ostrea edulis TaxID=37623 RepID=UPI0024AFB5D7|nr:uncharacterized protein LOC125652575 isoform X1 [Ostrea edulis]XP_056022618.1 uncharacterized protein LOC125652575 isoform X1 [Ostrea edulis]
MSCPLTVEQISLCRQGSNIDLEAVFQGHISGRRLQGVKSNPIYHDKHRLTRTTEVSENDFNITVYNSFPLKRQRNVDYGDPPFLPSGEENPNFSGSVAKVTNSTEGNDMQRESLKVTNGDVVVGDIIIETDYRNTPKNEEDAILEMEKLTKAKHLYGDSVASENNNVEKLNKKQELDEMKLKNVNEVNKKDGDHLLKESTNVTNGKSTGMDESMTRGDKDSDWPEIDDLVVSKETELCDTVKCESENVSESSPHEKENGSLTQEKLNGVLSNGNADSNGLHVNGKIPNGNHQHDVSHLEEETETKKSKKSKKNSRKKKVRERKNSLPDHILNSLAMKPKKPILIPTCSDANSSSYSDGNRLNSSITEQKSVKFSKDTVFNENKPNKYRKEKMQDRCKPNGMASSNPVFVDDNGFEISLTDDEKVLHFSNSSDTNSQLSELNVPGYMKEYVIGSEDLPPVTRTPMSRAKLQGIEDIEKITSDTTYKDLDRELSKRHRNKVIRLVLACFVFLVVIGVVVLLVVYFGKPQPKS